MDIASLPELLSVKTFSTTRIDKSLKNGLPHHRAAINPPKNFNSIKSVQTFFIHILPHLHTDSVDVIKWNFGQNYSRSNNFTSIFKTMAVHRTKKNIIHEHLVGI